MSTLTKSAPLLRRFAGLFALVALAVTALSVTSGGAKAAFVSFTSLGDINPPLNITSLVPSGFIKGVFTPSLGGGGDIPNQNPATISPILETQLGLASGSVSFVGGGACSDSASNCSGFGTTSGSTTNVGNLFGVHIGGKGGGVYVAFLYDHPVSNFSLSWAQENDINTLSNIHTFTTVTPIPAAAWLFGSGLAVLGFVGRKRKKGDSPSA